MSNSEYISYETPQKPQSAEAPVAKALVRARWTIVSALTVGLLFSVMLIFAFRSVYDTGYYSLIYGCEQLISLALWILGCWQLTRMPQKSFRIGGWLLGAYGVFGKVVIYLDTWLEGLLFGSQPSFLVWPSLNVIGFILLLLAIAAFCHNGGANYGAASLIIAINIFSVGLWFVRGLPFLSHGLFFQECTYFGPILTIGLIWAWWMFFKYSSPEYETDPLSFRDIVLNRVTVSVLVVTALMLVTLPFIAKVTLNS